MTMRTRQNKPPCLQLPLLSLQDDRQDAEYDDSCLNLGAETPVGSTPALSRVPSRESSWLRTGDPFANMMNVPPRSGFHLSRRGSTSQLRQPSAQTTSAVINRKDVWDRDCGICFEAATNPHKTVCCGKLFCLEHINDWLAKDDYCPSCRAHLGSQHQLASFRSPPPEYHSPSSDSEDLPENHNHLSDSRTPSPSYEKDDEELDQGWSSAWKRHVAQQRRQRQRRTHSAHLMYPSVNHSTDNIIQHEDAIFLSRVASIMFLTLMYYVLFA